jgi:hypothetical protein
MKGKGVGRHVAEQVFNQFPGIWETSQRKYTHLSSRIGFRFAQIQILELRACLKSLNDCFLDLFLQKL